MNVQTTPSGLLVPAGSRIISLEEAVGIFGEPEQPKASKMTLTREAWKTLLKQEGRTVDLNRMEKAEAKRRRKAAR